MKKNAIRILLADDHEILRTGLSDIIEGETDMTVVAQAADGAEAVRLAAETRPDLIVMDLMMPGMNGAEATARILSAAGDNPPKIVILTTFGTAAELALASRAGISGALVKDESAENLIESIRRIAAGKRVFSKSISRALAASRDLPDLTLRQIEILRAVKDGLSNSEIAKRLGVSADAVKKHLIAIFRKFGASTRAEALAIALERHML